MGYLRAIEGYSRPPEELTDSWLLRLFPGRTLEELDAMDMVRLQRALEARSIETTEGRRTRYLAGELDSKSIDDDEFVQFAEHDRIARELAHGDQ